MHWHELWDAWPALLGWPTVFLGVILAVLGLAFERRAMTVAGLMGFVPLSLYLTLFEPTMLWAVAALGGITGSIVAVRRKRRGLAVLATLPFVALLLRFLYLTAF